MDLEKDVKTVIDSLSQGIKGETVSKHRDTVRFLKATYDNNNDYFLEMLDIAYFEFGELVESVFNIPEQKDMYIVQFIANGLYEHFHEKRIEKLEGFPCSADKSIFIRDMTLKALKEKTNLSLYADYTHVDQIKENKKRRAYWSPTTVKDTDEAIRLFWDWYQLRK